VLILGATDFDSAVLRAVGFNNVTLSYFATRSSSALSIDAEDIALPDGSFDMVFAHEVLHHVRSPHKALCEMLRVARKHVIFMEPNDSFTMRMLVATGFSFPFEVLSVQAHGFQSGGVRNTNVPNYIYRWTRREVEKTVSSYLAETGGLVHASGYWDLNLDELDLSLRATTTRLRLVSSLVGEKCFFGLLRSLQRILNVVPGIRRQGNKFFCLIEKESALRPWLAPSGEGVVFNQSFSVHRRAG
jgi:SAM-dependent methyltransferase